MPRIMLSHLIGLVAYAALTVNGAAADDELLYQQHVKTIFKTRCYACHGALAQEANLRVDTAQNILTGGDSGTAVVPGQLDESLLWSRVSDSNDTSRMPPEGKPLSPEELNHIRQWITAGAKSPPDETPEADPKQHWSFQPPRANLPAPTQTSASSNPIDIFLDASRKRQTIVTTREAERSILLRRVYLDLIGLPPTQQQQAAFLTDTRPDAYERVVDSLLASPHYGERWARHWMDIWRYSDWYGLGDQLRNSQKHIWHWRDWIIDSLNSDLGYHHMVTDMLAADELAPTDPARLRATGFLARNYYLFNRTTWLDTTIENTAQAFLGLTLNCCKCHDHKYDPLTQEDFYRFRAIFEPHQVRLDSLPGQTNLELNGLPRVFDAHPEIHTYVFRRGDEKQPVTNQPMTAGTPALFAAIGWTVTPRALPLEAHWPAARPFVVDDHLQQADLRLYTTLQQAEQSPCAPPEQEKRRLVANELHAAEITAIRAAFEADRARATNAANTQTCIAEAARHERRFNVLRAERDVAEAEQILAGPSPPTDGQAKLDEARKRLDTAQQAQNNSDTTYTSILASRKALEGPDETPASQNQPYPQYTTGRRAALAEWITHRDNPLTSRVAVNHIWLRHFGQPLVEPVNDFGRRTPPPLHQPLLDWLAVNLQQHDWSMKWLHRLIVTSQAYRQSAVVAPELYANLSADPTNKYYWHRTPVRMESQTIRDSLLSLAGTLNVDIGGPSIDARKDEAPYRRSLYFVHSLEDRHEFLSKFDDADVLQCYRRSESVVPQQALALANSRLALQMADEITQQIYEQSFSGVTTPRDQDFVGAAFQLLLGRSCSVEELQACNESLAAWRDVLVREQHATPDRQSHVNLVHALINHNDFITIR